MQEIDLLPETITKEHISKHLSYMHSFLLEVLRYYPVAPLIGMVKVMKDV